MMDLTAGTRATAVGAALIIGAGLSIVLYGIIADDLPRTIGGAIGTMTALTFICLVAIRRWVTNTAAERKRLGDAVRDADADRMRYVAAQAALEAERGRLQRDAAAERQQLTARLHTERAALDARFEEERAKLICETTEAAFRLFHDGRLDTSDANSARIIGFPTPAHHQRAAQESHRGATRG
ncbi:hypothetical protein [Streptomyces sp. NPDC102437]|uniref:hypothetical protein n=1 Tax=Streptomyces sp. NPDC102437 TaxID=3366175 RepID=UPI0037F166F0